MEKEANPKRLFNNLEFTLSQMCTSREDLFTAAQLTLQAYEAQCKQNETLTKENGHLWTRIDALGSEINCIEAKVLFHRDEYIKEVVRASDLEQQLKDAQKKVPASVEKPGHLQALSAKTDILTEEAEEVDLIPFLGKANYQKETNRAESLTLSEMNAESRPTMTSDATFNRPSSSQMEAHLKRPLQSTTWSNSMASCEEIPHEMTASLTKELPVTSKREKEVKQPKNAHAFLENTKLSFQSCQLCKSKIMPLVKFFRCAQCGLKVDSACLAESTLEVDCSNKDI